MTRLTAFATTVCRALSFVGAAAVLAMMAHICLDVALRGLFRVSMNTTPEIVARYYMVAIAFLPLGFLHMTGQMISVELLDVALGRRGRAASDAVVALVAASVYAILAQVTLAKALGEAASGAFVDLVRFQMPVWHSYFLVPLGFGLAALACLVVAADAALKVRR